MGYLTESCITQVLNDLPPHRYQLRRELGLMLDLIHRGYQIKTTAPAFVQASNAAYVAKIDVPDEAVEAK